VIIHDPLYGRFEIPRFLDRLVMAPEVRRLMDVRLLNAPTPSLPTLSEIRRFSHTLGVLRLVLLNPHIGLRKDEVRALSAAVLIHDAATPPFAHLLEYYLKDRSGWTHEAALPEMLTGHLFPDNVAHQILPGQELKFRRLCEMSDIDFQLVLQIARKQHRASPLLFGFLDFDNLDNVLRMGWALGLKPDPSPFLSIARELAVSIEGEPILSKDLKQAIQTWAEFRRRAYEILVFDEMTVASQAVLTKAMRLFFNDVRTSDIDWARRDRDLLDLLTASRDTKLLMLRHFHDSLPGQLLVVQVPGSLNELGFRSRDAAITFIEDMARDEFDVKTPFGYVFVDRAIFSKRLEFIDPATRQQWGYGSASNSVVFYCFGSSHSKRLPRMKRTFNEAFLAALKRAA
jgi:HD superfamily phosphohydrolase